MASAYREYGPPRDLAALVACVWESEADEDRMHVVVPDGCLDLIWLGPQQLVVAGADTGPRYAHLQAGARLSGIRLRPGAAGAVLGLPAAEVCDQDVPLRDLWGDAGSRLEAALDGARPAERRRLLAAAVANRHAQPDPLVRAAAQKLATAETRVAAVASDLGVSERQLHRRVTAAVGYPPKTLARVARLRRLVALSDPSLASRAVSAGYASQAHMNEEVRRLTGTTPVRFLKDATLTAA